MQADLDVAEAVAVGRASATRPTLSLLGGALFVSWSAILIRLAKLEGGTATFYRLSIPLLILVPVAARRGVLRSATVRQAVWAMAGGALLTADLIAWSTAIVHSDATIPTVLANLTPIWVGLGTVMIFRQRPRRAFWLGAAIALFGAGMLAGITWGSFAALDGNSVLAIFGGIFYSGYLMVTQRIRAGLDNVAFLMWVCLGGLVTDCVFVAFHGDSLRIATAHAVWQVVLLALGPQLVGWLLINWAMAYIAGTTAAVTLLFQPVVTGFWAFLVFDQRLGARQLIAGAIILVGVLVVHLDNWRAARATLT